MGGEDTVRDFALPRLVKVVDGEAPGAVTDITGVVFGLPAGINETGATPPGGVAQM